MAKVITGIRRYGKSYLLGVLYKNYLLSNGVKDDHIIEIPLDEPGKYKFHNPLKLEEFIKIKEERRIFIRLSSFIFIQG
jgi:predicted AAA+ superfamily ATPase